MINKIKENIYQFCFKGFGSCVYFIKLNNKNILIDTSSENNKQELIEDLSELGLGASDIDFVIITHNHWDHIGNNDLFSESKIYDFNNINELNFNEFKIIQTPGHTIDSFCILYEDVLFSGDTIFHDNGRGRTDLEGGSEQEILKSIETLKKLNYKILCPGHVD